METVISRLDNKDFGKFYNSKMEAFRDLARFAKSFFLKSLVLGSWFLVLSNNVSGAERPDTFADLAERLSPSVVNISTSTLVERGSDFDLPQFCLGLGKFYDIHYFI